MAVSAQAGVFSFGAQSAKGANPTTWYRHRATMVDLAPVDDVREGPPEIGGIAVPTFPYKAGLVVAGGATLQPRLQSTFGWLLYGLLGSVTSAADPYNLDVYDHAFKLSSSDSTYVPYMGFRKVVPRKDNDADTDLGERYEDCKIVGGSLVLPNDAPLTMRFDVVGRKYTFDPDPHLWTYANTMEDWQSAPVACQTGGYLKIDGSELPVVSAQVGFQNVPLDMRTERVYGDPYIEDVTIIQRRLMYDITCKWQDPTLYRKVHAGGATGTTWSGKPYTSSFEVKTVSSMDMPSETEPYSLTVAADSVMMTQQGGIQLAGNNAVMLRFTGVALEATNYAIFTLRNKTASYVWPV